MQLTQKQNEYVRNANRRWNIKCGAVRSGKSFVDVFYTIPNRLRSLADAKGLNVIIGVSKSTIERNVLQPMRELFTSDAIGTINSQNIAYVCGVPVYCLGAEKVSQVAKIQGTSIKYCYGDEIAKWNQEVFRMLQSRLDKPYSCFDGACNPESPGHWLKGFLDRTDIDAYIQKYTIFDNPYLPEKFVDDLCTEYQGTVYYGRYIEGEWTLAEGLIYPMYEDAIEPHPVLMDQLSGKEMPAEKYVLSLDYGTQNAFAGLLWAKYGDTWYAIREYYYSGRETGIQKTDEEYAADLDKWLEDITPGFGIRTIIDPSAASFIALLKKRNHRYKVMPANNSVLDGIRDTATCMHRGKIKFDPSLTNWKKEVQGYVWMEDEREDKPIKVNDHLMDSMRYFVKTMNLAAVKTHYTPIIM